MIIREDDPAGPEIIALLGAHLDYSAAHSQFENAYALDPERLRGPDISFFTAWDPPDQLLGCGALRELSSEHGELKSMHTAQAARRRGVGRAMLAHLIAEARRRGYRQISLETGSMPGFAAARSMYKRFGFVPCEPFGNYKLCPDSVYMRLFLV